MIRTSHSIIKPVIITALVIGTVLLSIVFAFRVGFDNGKNSVTGPTFFIDDEAVYRTDAAVYLMQHAPAEYASLALNFAMEKALLDAEAGITQDDVDDYGVYVATAFSQAGFDAEGFEQYMHSMYGGEVDFQVHASRALVTQQYIETFMPELVPDASDFEMLEDTHYVMLSMDGADATVVSPYTLFRQFGADGLDAVQQAEVGDTVELARDVTAELVAEGNVFTPSDLETAIADDKYALMDTEYTRRAEQHVLTHYIGSGIIDMEFDRLFDAAAFVRGYESMGLVLETDEE